MPKRSLNNTVKIQARGIFKGARVVRGYDWEWDSQDGKTKEQRLVFFFINEIRQEEIIIMVFLFSSVGLNRR